MNLKKTISVFIATVLASVVFVISAFSKPVSNNILIPGTTIFDVDFDTVKNNTAITNVPMGDDFVSAGTGTIVNTDGKSGYLKLAQDQSITVSAINTIAGESVTTKQNWLDRPSPLSDVFTTEFNFRLPTVVAFEQLFKADCNTSDLGTSEYLSIKISETGILKAMKSESGAGGESVYGLIANRWYNLKIVTDMNSHTYDTYLDGVIVADDIPFVSGKFSDETSMNRTFMVKASAEIHIDNMRIYKEPVGRRTFAADDFSGREKITYPLESTESEATAGGEWNKYYWQNSFAGLNLHRRYLHASNGTMFQKNVYIDTENERAVVGANAAIKTYVARIKDNPGNDLIIADSLASQRQLVVEFDFTPTAATVGNICTITDGNNAQYGFMLYYQDNSFYVRAGKEGEITSDNRVNRVVLSTEQKENQPYHIKVFVDIDKTFTQIVGGTSYTRHGKANVYIDNKLVGFELPLQYKADANDITELCMPFAIGQGEVPTDTYYIDNLAVYSDAREKVLSTAISDLMAANMEMEKINLPTSSNSDYTLTWESMTKDIVGDDGLIYSRINKDQKATFKVTVTDKSGQHTVSETVDIIVPRDSFLEKKYKTPQKLASRTILEKTGLTTHYLNIAEVPTIRTYVTSQNWTSDGKSFICGLQTGIMFLYNTEDETLTFIDYSIPSTQLLLATVGTDDYVYYVKRNENGEYSIWKADLTVAPAVPELVCNALEGTAIGLLHITNDCKYLSAELYSADNASQSISGRYSIDAGKWVTYTHPTFEFSPSKTHDIINPEYPNLMSFCHEINHSMDYEVNAYNIYDRIWQLDLDTMEAKNIFKQGMQSADRALQGATHEVWSNDGEYMYFIAFNMGATYNKGSVPAVVRFDKDGSHRKYYNGENALIHNYKHCTSTGDNKFVGADGEWIVVLSTETWEEFPISQFSWNGPSINHPYHAHPVIAREQYVMNWGDTDENGLLGIKWYDFTDLVASKAVGGSTPMGENVTRVSFLGLDCDSAESTIGGKNCVNAESGNSIYLDIDESLIDTDNGKIKLIFDYYDNSLQPITVTYTSGVETDNDRYRIFDAEKTIERTGTNTWKMTEVIIDSGNFEDIGKYNTDIKISGGTENVSIAGVSADLYGAEKIIADIVKEFKAACPENKISGNNITLPGLPAEYSGYKLKWKSTNSRIDTATGVVANGTKSDATLTVTASDGNGDEATALFNLSLFVDYTSGITPVDYQIDGITFEDTAGNTVYSPTNSGKLKSVLFRNNTNSTQNVSLIAAVYENDILKTCKIAKNVKDGKIDFELSLSASAQDAEVKFYVWSGDGLLSPLGDAKIVEEAGRKLFILADQIYDESPPATQYSTGVGFALKDFFNQSSLPIVNLADSGLSYKTFGETLFAIALEQIDKGDYVLLSFCHTDVKYTGLDSDGAAPFEIGSYEYFIEKYVETIRLKGGVPIIATSIPRHIFKNDVPTSNHGGHYTAALKVAELLDVPLMDVYSKTFADLKTLGSVATIKYYVNPVGENTTIGSDFTHLSAEGADWVSEIIVELAAELKLPFAKYSIER